MSLPTKHTLLSNLTLVSQPAGSACNICLESYEAARLFRHGGDLSEETTHQAVQTPCSHVFGETCLAQWLESANSCPLCRQHLYEAEAEVERMHGPVGDEDEAFFQGIRDDMAAANLELSNSDAEYREQLTTLFVRISTSRDDEEVAATDAAIEVLQDARLMGWVTGTLAVESGDFFSSSQGAVEKGVVLPEGRVFVVDGHAIEEKMYMYFHYSLSNALARLARARKNGGPSIGDRGADTVLHPAALALWKTASRAVEQLDGRRMTVPQLRQMLLNGMRRCLEEYMPWGLEAVMHDLAQVGVVAMCGRPVGVCDPRSRDAKWEVLEL